MGSLTQLPDRNVGGPSPGLTIKLAGELDSATSTELLARFEQALAALDERELVIDLDEVSFIDSSGLRALILIERRAEEDRIALAIAPAPTAVTELLHVTGLADRLPLTPRTQDSAPAGPFLERIEIALARDADAPARARAELRQAIAGRLSDRDSATATLLTSELVTNAVIHPRHTVGGSVGTSDNDLPGPHPRRGHRRRAGLRAGGPAAATSQRDGWTRADRRRRALQPLGNRPASGRRKRGLLRLVRTRRRSRADRCWV